MPGVGRANCLLGIRGGAGITGRDVDGGATARVVSELERTRQRLFIVLVRGSSGISGRSHPCLSQSIDLCSQPWMPSQKVLLKKRLSVWKKNLNLLRKILKPMHQNPHQSLLEM